MTEILKLSGATALAMHTMALLASAPRTRKTWEMARSMGVHEFHLSKVLIRLTNRGYLEAIRGPQGGYRLAKDPRKVRLIEVYEAMEGKFAPQDCLLGKPVCPRRKCVLGGLIKKINKEVGDYLKNTRVSDLAEKDGKE